MESNNKKSRLIVSIITILFLLYAGLDGVMPMGTLMPILSIWGILMYALKD